MNCHSAVARLWVFPEWVEIFIHKGSEIKTSNFMFWAFLPVRLWLDLPVWGCRALGGRKGYKHAAHPGAEHNGMCGLPSFPGANWWVSRQQLYFQCCLSRVGPREGWTSAQGGNFNLSWGSPHSRSFPNCFLLTSMAFLMPHRYTSLSISLFSSWRPGVISHQLGTCCLLYSVHH